MRGLPDLVSARPPDQTGGLADAVARGHVFILTGVAGSGKTTRCKALAQAARAAGLTVRGFMATVVGTGDGAERWVEDLNGGERRLLGRRVSPEGIALGSPRWQLDDAALAWSDAVLKVACPTDLLIIDEVGPVELLHRQGALAGVEHALAGRYRLAVVVVRPGLVPRFRQLFPAPPAELVDVGDTAALETRLAGLTATNLVDGRVTDATPVDATGDGS